MKILLGTLLVVGGAMLLAAACGGPPPASPAPEASTPRAESAAKAGPEDRWDRTVAAAKKEGLVRIYTIWRPETRVVLSQPFQEKYGIELEFAMFARGSDLLAKFQAEKRAGLHLADVFGVGGTTLIASMKPEGVLGPVEPLLILPEVVNPKMWRGGELPIKDKGGFAVSMVAGLQRYIFYNSDIIKQGEITTYKDLLKPQYKGKIALNDPSVTGTGNAMFGHLSRDLWTPQEAYDYLRQLLKQQEAVIERDKRLHVEWVARGKYPVGLGGTLDSMGEFVKMGAPIQPVVLKEGHKVTSGSGAVGVPAVSPHPNATMVFLNWLLSKEGQTHFAVKGFGQPSLRTDVTTEGIQPMFIPGPEEKIFLDSEEEILFRGQEMIEQIEKIIREAMR
ncbi:MAG: extracellular solute-binding protein [Chloroflexi bacterium]|nr:extracellular solute-binding protein [Chloroflexota bacterium]